MMSTNLFEGNTAITVAMRTSRSMIQKQTIIIFTFCMHNAYAHCDTNICEPKSNNDHATNSGAWVRYIRK